MAKISSSTKKWITVVAMLLLSAYSISSPIDLKSVLPAWIATPKLGQFSLINIAAYLVLIGAGWIINKDI